MNRKEFGGGTRKKSKPKIQIPIQIKFKIQLKPMDATSKELLSKVKIAARSRGLVLVPFGTAHCKAVVGRSDASLAAAEFATAAHTPERARASFRRAIKRQLAALQGAPGAGAFCGHSLTTDFKKLLLLGAADLYRSDTAMVLAFQCDPTLKLKLMPKATPMPLPMPMQWSTRSSASRPLAPRTTRS